MLDGEVDTKSAALTERSYMELWVHALHISSPIKVSGGEIAGARDVDPDSHRLIALAGKNNVF